MPEISTLPTAAKPGRNRSRHNYIPKIPREHNAGANHRGPAPAQGSPRCCHSFIGAPASVASQHPRSQATEPRATGPVHQVWGAKRFAAGLCRAPAKRQPGQGGDNTPPPLSFANQGRNCLARPSYARRLPPPQPKGFFPSGAQRQGEKRPEPPPSPRGGDTFVPRSIPSIAAVTPARRNDAKPVLLWVGSGRRPRGFTWGGAGWETRWVRAGEAPKTSRQARAALWAAPSHKPSYRPTLGRQENSSPCERIPRRS